MRIRLWDLHAARRFARRLRAAGVAEEDIVVRGDRTSDGLVEADVKPLSRMTTRWKVNIVVAIAAAIIVGVPMGSSLASLLLGEHPAVMTAGAVFGGVGLAGTGLYGVWGDHFQRFADSRSDTRVEGYVTVTGDTSIVRAEMLLTTTDDVMGVHRQVIAPRGP